MLVEHAPQPHLPYSADQKTFKHLFIFDSNLLCGKTFFSKTFCHDFDVYHILVCKTKEDINN